ncbi:hypothetical protein Pst134EA_009879 [Puccinia striiformis f. sp. tritici]|uniref:hypothetical protein n=1 Tax=Puccinia striiformis f. sp. tritici TaxID=168172 RepID=UPI0020085B97|nr:hypothetical protein Pst134EA_009879 [Puccinia striiformis f. sp. tritici]KAH9469358.1 hypothetical protein Pst134EA_009879 [Puccinia striiformis f. sp. tritici]
MSSLLLSRVINVNWHYFSFDFSPSSVLPIDLDLDISVAEMATSLTNPDLFTTNEFKRMLPGYIALIPLLAQTFLMNPCYEKSRNEGMIKAGNYRGDPDDKDEMQKPDYQPKPQTLPLERIKFTIWILFRFQYLIESYQKYIYPQSTWTRDVMGSESQRRTAWTKNASAGSFFLFILGKTVVCHFMMTLLWFIAVSCAQHPQGSWGFLDDYIGLGPFKWVKNYPQLDHLKAAPFGGAAWFAIDTLGCLFNLLEIILFQVGPYILPKDLAPGKFDTTLCPAYSTI